MRITPSYYPKVDSTGLKWNSENNPKVDSTGPKWNSENNPKVDSTGAKWNSEAIEISHWLWDIFLIIILQLGDVNLG